MTSWQHAFSLSKSELRDSEPPGTVRLVGMWVSVLHSPIAYWAGIYGVHTTSTNTLCRA